LKLNVRKVFLKQGKYDCNTVPESPGHYVPESAVLLRSFVLLVVCLCAPSFWISLGIAAGQQHPEFLKKQLHCKKRFAIFPSPAGMSLTILSLADYSRLGRVSLVTSRLHGDRKIVNLFFTA
jgi:hypothetical protein